MPDLHGSSSRVHDLRRWRPLAALATLVILLGIMTLPTLAADPSESPGVPGESAEPVESAAPEPSAEPVESVAPEPSAEPVESAQPEETAEPANSAEPEPQQKAKPDKAAKAQKAKVPKEAITLSGTVTAGTDENGDPVYRLSSGGTTYDLDAGPPWFFGDNYPLKSFVGKSVTIAGEIAEGSTEVDVVSVNGTVLREPGKPPWAGGWKRVGERHPGWSEEKAARMAEKAERRLAKFGDCFPPGQCKQDAQDTQEIAPTH